VMVGKGKGRGRGCLSGREVTAWSVYNAAEDEYVHVRVEARQRWVLKTSVTVYSKIAKWWRWGDREDTSAP